MEILEKPQEIDCNRLEDKHFELKSNKCYNELNRLLFSTNCIYLYILLIFFSIVVFFYSFMAHFLKLSNTK